ncbi:alpha/beta-hydrolase [Sarocladium strictum]
MDTIIWNNASTASARARWEGLGTTGSNNVATSKDGIMKCLNVPFATVPYRWAAPRPAPFSWAGTRDCTSFGPGCPQTAKPLFDVDGIPLFGRLGAGSIPIRAEHEDEFACLNLNVFAPARRDKAGLGSTAGKLPVLVWVHGGSYTVGSSSVDLYDCTRLVKRSCELGMPFVAVTFNYRVGVLGFLHSKELVKDAVLQSEVPPQFRSTGNLGLVDSYHAFQWVKQNIAHFGGDPENITAIGESAGAGTINYLVLSPQLKVHVRRVIMCSSTCSTIQLLREDQAQQSFDTLCRQLDIDPERPNADAVSKLRETPVEQLLRHGSSISHAFRPTWDDITIGSDPRQVVFKPELWNESLTEMIIGVCQSESWARQSALLDQEANLQHLVDGRIPPDRQDLREKAYALYADGSKFPWFKMPPGTPADHRGSVAFEGHMRYYSPADLFSDSIIRHQQARSTESDEPVGKALYRFILSWTTNHFHSSWPVTHTADILLTFLHKSLSDEEMNVAYSFTDELIALVAGRKEVMRWKPYTAAERCLNELHEDGQWRVRFIGSGEFDLDDDFSALCEEVLKASLSRGRASWKGMVR